MKQLFILGAGFSKAITPQMPTLWELSQNAIDWEALPIKTQEYKGLSEDIEQFLTYLYQEMPWKSQEEIHLDKAAFIAVTKQIGDYIQQCESGGLSENVPKWGMAFAKYLHRQRANVATLNYDTILETLSSWIATESETASNVHRLDIKSLYRLPIASLLGRTRGIWSGPQIETFRLLKLHGSINWFSAVTDDSNSTSQVYYKVIAGLQPIYLGEKRTQTYKQIRTDNGSISGTTPIWETPKAFQYQRYNHQESQHAQLDLSPLIIPPVADKSTFYKMRLVKVLWNEFREAVKQAEEIYCIGYSLPKTDLTIRLFLRSLSDTKDKKVFLVNSATGEAANELVQNYRNVFQNCEIDETYLRQEDAVETMAKRLCSKEDWPLPDESVEGEAIS